LPRRVGIEEQQQIGRPRRVERPTQGVAEVDHVADTQRGDIGKHRFECEMVAVNVCDGSEAHGQLPR
jgi:hypothetical protein